MSGPSRGLRGVSDADLGRLLEAIRSERLACPLASTSLQFAGLGHLAEKAPVLVGLGRPAVLAVLEAVHAERHDAPPPGLELVWTGPERKILTQIGEPAPRLYYLPENLRPGARASLHAKCVVVDRGRTLLTSANFIRPRPEPEPGTRCANPRCGLR